MSVYIKVPAAIDIRERFHNTDTQRMEYRHMRTMPFFDIIDWLTNDIHFSKPSKMARVAAELIAEFEHAAPGTYVKLTSEQHGHIKKVLEEPSSPMNPFVGKQVVSFLDALLDPLTEEQWKKENNMSTNGYEKISPPG